MAHKNRLLQRRSLLAVSACLFLSSSLAIAQNSSTTERPLPSHCYSSAVHEIERPVFTDKPSAKFKYEFSMSEREDAEAPVIIFIPGGPGETSMSAPLGYPYDFAIVRTDPRGRGCNEENSLPVQSLSSENIAKDILAIIKTLKPKRYFLHGISYGTVVATMVGALAEKEGVQLPEGIILEGILGRAFEPNEYLQGATREWQRVKAELPRSVQEIVSAPTPPFGLKKHEFAAWLASVLNHGVLPSGSSYALSELMLLDPNAEAGARQSLQMRLKIGLKSPEASKVKIYKEIACRELVPDVRDVKFDFVLKDGELTGTDSRLCKGMPFDHRWNSKRYLVKSPLYYFHGDMDPVVTLAQAKYHYEHQKAPRVFVQMSKGGHTPLSTNLQDCNSEFWKSLLKSPKGLSAAEVTTAFKGCALAESLRVF